MRPIHIGTRSTLQILGRSRLARRAEKYAKVPAIHCCVVSLCGTVQTGIIRVFDHPENLYRHLSHVVYNAYVQSVGFTDIDQDSLEGSLVFRDQAPINPDGNSRYCQSCILLNNIEAHGG